MIKKTYFGRSDAQAQVLRQSILGATDGLPISGKRYYVSASGGESDGLRQDAPISIDRVKILDLQSGDAVLFKRGDCFRPDATIPTVSGVSYGAYGEGDKPLLLGSRRNYADAALWQKTPTANIWSAKIPSRNPGILSFNGDVAFGELRDSPDELRNEFDSFCDADTEQLYLYCEQGNPGDVYEKIEIATLVTFLGGDDGVRDVVIDNIAMRYCAGHAVSFGNHADGITVTNCEIGYCGGMRWGTERLGNGVQFWLNARNIRVENCWVYQQFDAGITFQSSVSAQYEHIYFVNNLLEYSNYNIEFFLSQSDDNSMIRDVEFSGNIMRFAGYGWGYNRPHVHGTANLTGWQTAVENTESFVIEDNVFDCSARSLVCWFWDEGTHQNGLSVKNNKFYQMPNKRDVPDKVKGGSSNHAVMSFGVKGNGFAVLLAQTQEEFESSVKEFDSDPAEMIWDS